jgi:hypothetical protein
LTARVILLQDVIEVLHRSVLAVLLQNTLVFDLHNRRRVTCVLVGIDDPGAGWFLSAQRFGEEAFGHRCIASSEEKETHPPLCESGDSGGQIRGALRFDPKRALPSCIGGRRAVPPEDCAGAWDYLQRMDWHRSHLPIDELHIMAEAIRRFVDSDGDRHPIGISANCAKRSIAGKPTRISN